MKSIAYVLMALAAVATAAIGVYSADGAISLAVFGLVLWAVSPYALMAALFMGHPSRGALTALSVTCAISGAAGLAWIINAMLVNTDAQGALVYVVAPLLQGVALLVMAVPLRFFLNRVTHA